MDEQNALKEKQMRDALSSIQRKYGLHCIVWVGQLSTGAVSEEMSDAQFYRVILPSMLQALTRMERAFYVKIEEALKQKSATMPQPPPQNVSG